MITLYLIQQTFNLAHYIIGWFFSPVVDMWSNLSGYIYALTIPVVFYDVLHLATFFLPTGTILVLFCITSAFISLEIVHSVARWLIHFCGLI